MARQAFSGTRTTSAVYTGLPGHAFQAPKAASSDAAMTNERPRLNQYAKAMAAISAAYGPALRSPDNDCGNGRPAHTSAAAIAMMAPGAQSGRHWFRRSFT